MFLCDTLSPALIPFHDAGDTRVGHAQNGQRSTHARLDPAAFDKPWRSQKRHALPVPVYTRTAQRNKGKGAHQQQLVLASTARPAAPLAAAS
jgi:hypothetical protein